MASIVSCPGCQRRLKLGADKPGGKLRCPNCNTPFVLGGRINPGASGPVEFQAFELFEENVVTDKLVIEEDKPAALPMSALKPRPKSSVTPKSQPPLPKSSAKPKPPPAPPPRPAAKPAAALLPDDLDLLGEGPKPIKVTPLFPPSEPSSDDEPVLPDDFGLKEETGGLWPGGQIEPPKKPPVDPPKKAPSPPPATKPAAKAAPAARGDFFLPDDFDPFATTPAKPAAPDLSLDDDVPAINEEEPNFEIIEENVRQSADGVPIIEGATVEESASADKPTSKWEPVGGRARKAWKRKRHGKAPAVAAEVRGRWGIVYWGVSLAYAATALYLVGNGLIAFGSVVMIFSLLIRVGVLFSLGSIVFFLAFFPLMLGSILDLVGRGLCIACPAKNMAMVWAMASLGLAVFGLVGLWPVMLVGFICFLVFLKNASEALREFALAEECSNLIKLVVSAAISGVIFAIFVAVLYFTGAVVVRAGGARPEDMSAFAWIMLIMMVLFGVLMMILSFAVLWKMFEVLGQLRHEIGWRLD